MSRNIVLTPPSVLASLATLLVALALAGAPAPAFASDEPTESPPLSAPLGAQPAAPEASATGPVSSANARFIVDTYQDLLGRVADDGGLDFHLSRLASGGDRSRKAFTYALLFSSEGSRQEVRRAYTGLLGRSADTQGEDYWTNHLQGRGVLDLRVLLLSSDEYFNRAGSESAWLEAVYDDTLDRAIDASGRQYWLDLRAAGVARPLVVAGIYRSDEALGLRVDTYFTEALSRAPTPSERTAAIATVRSQGERGLRAQLWSSDEAFETFLQAAWP